MNSPLLGASLNDPFLDSQSDFFLLSSIPPLNAYQNDEDCIDITYNHFFSNPTDLLSANACSQSSASIETTIKTEVKRKARKVFEILHTAPKRRKKNIGPSISSNALDEQRLRRAERNKCFAKESRERKRMYIQRLEQENALLQWQLEYCRRTLNNYEFIEKHRGSVKDRLNCLLVNAYTRYRNTFTENSNLPIEIIRKNMEEMMMEHQRAVNDVVDILASIATPPAMQILTWIKKMEDKSVAQSHSSLGETKYMETVFREKGVLRELEEFVLKSSERVEQFTEELRKAQSRIQIEYTRIKTFLDARMAPNLDGKMIEMLTRDIPKFKDSL
eukprot:TRINITY_DN2610_c0_g1_i16.p1 TRINITY_DN2610_c0_g1~~TRINITY_DN2610_c0_g1_i16.p1  ORF type:complete len:331 (+),score=35.17 TRINITY_DN2610_c0_g1_i16:211-1203(+)